MQLSYNGLKFIEDAEGFRPEAYRDGGGVWTIGYGTTHVDGKPVEAGMTCTRSQADLWMAADTASVQTAINQLVKVPLKQSQFDALVSFTYNEGIGAFRTSTLLKLLNQSNYQMAQAEFARWNKDNGVVVPGLVSRRFREARLFEG
jgi:lysozyme